MKNPFFDHCFSEPYKLTKKDVSNLLDQTGPWLWKLKEELLRFYH